MQATLALEDGRVFRGKGYGAKGECYGEGHGRISRTI